MLARSSMGAALAAVYSTGSGMAPAGAFRARFGPILHFPLWPPAQCAEPSCLSRETAMVKLLDHPSQQQLDAFALGTLGDGDSQGVEEHLDHCERCQELATRAGGDTLV